MSDTMLVKEAARLWNITERRVSALCKEGKIKGAKKQGKSWLIPIDAQKPDDRRVKSGIYIKNSCQSNLPLPIGISDYRLASSEYYYIDKTMMIKDFIDERPMVSLFTRPRRFGKTLNMDMLRTFFEKTDEDTSVYFRDKKIWACGKKYREYQGKYPVIFITFKDVKFNTWEETFNAIKEAFSAADASVALFQSALFASVVAIVMAVSKKIFTVSEAIDVWVDGMKTLVITGVILICAWSLSSVIKELGTAKYIITLLSGSFPGFLLPSLIFILGSII